MRDKIILILTALGVTGAADDPLIDFIIQNVTERIKNETNLAEVPEGLQGVAANMAVGEFLNLKKTLGQLEGFDLELAIKQIQEGDTNITFAIGEGSMTPEDRLNNLINYLVTGRVHEIIRYRRLIW